MVKRLEWLARVNSPIVRDQGRILMLRHHAKQCFRHEDHNALILRYEY